LSDLAVESLLNFVFAHAGASSALSSAEIQEVKKLLKVEAPSTFQQIARLGFQSYSNVVSPRFRIAAVKVLKTIRKTKAKKLKNANECRVNEIILSLEKKGFTKRKFKNHRSALCLSYDIDQKVCWDRLDELATILKAKNLPATFNILTDWEYKFEWDKALRLNQLGFEIGLHGASHDISFGYRSRSRIMNEIGPVVKAAPLKLTGYRAPALSMSPTLMQSVRDLGFLYDSSLPMSNMYYKSVESCFPFQDALTTLWQIPVTMQDNTCFLDQKLSSEDSVVWAIDQVNQIHQIGGVNAVNLHPYISMEHPEFHLKFLDYLAEAKDMWKCTHKELFDFIQSEQKSIRAPETEAAFL
jgi:hypothetical protein